MTVSAFPHPLGVRFFNPDSIEDAESNVRRKPNGIPMNKDKQLRGIKLARVLEKQRLGQALNIKEFAVLAGISYSVAREWFQLKGFPRFESVVFWQDFVAWRNDRTGGKVADKNLPQPTAPFLPETKRPISSGLPSRSAQILLESVK